MHALRYIAQLLVVRISHLLHIVSLQMLTQYFSLLSHTKLAHIAVLMCDGQVIILTIELNVNPV